MSLEVNINGVPMVIPAVYSTLKVQDSFLNVVPSPKTVVVVGEAVDGPAYDSVDPQQNYFTNFESLKAVYKAGPIVDASYQLFSQQADNVFTGPQPTVYVAKTNRSTQAYYIIENPTSYGILLSKGFGLSGNALRVQIQQVDEEKKPEATYTWLGEATDFKVAVMGERIGQQSVIDDITVVEALSDPRVSITSSKVELFDVDGGSVVISQADKNVTFTSSVFVAIPEVGSTLVYNGIKFIVTGVTATAISTVPLSGSVVFETVDLDNSDIECYSPVKVKSLKETPLGASNCLEVYSSNPQAFLNWSSNNVMDVAQAVVASASVEKLTTQLKIVLSDSVFKVKPKVGEFIYIPLTSKLAGPNKENVGVYIIEKITFNEVYLKLKASCVNVAKVALEGQSDFLIYLKANVSSPVARNHISSEKEYTVMCDILNTETTERVPTASIGGKWMLKLGWAGVGSATATIKNKILTVNFSDGSIPSLSISLLKFGTLRHLATYLKSIPDLYADENPEFAGTSPQHLDEVVTGISTYGSQSFVGIKRDFYEFQSAFEGTEQLSFFSTAPQKSGLPLFMSNPRFLTGGTINGTSNEDVLGAMERTMKMPVRQVVSCFSRDADQDIMDEVTDQTSSYDIFSVNSMILSSVNTASNIQNKKERLALLSFDGSFQDSIKMAGTLFSPRASCTFQQVKAVGANGVSKWFAPWMIQAMLATGRAQSILGTSALNKAYNIVQVRHLKTKSLFTSSYEFDFYHEDRGQIELAIRSGLLVFGLKSRTWKMVSPDCTTQSKTNDPKAWFYERSNVIFAIDEIIDTVRVTLDNYIGVRNTDLPNDQLAKAVDSILGSFARNGSLDGYKPTVVETQGNLRVAKIAIKPVETTEFIHLDVSALREI